jgi:hypothetical protein
MACLVAYVGLSMGHGRADGLTVTVWFQQQDSCKQAVAGGSFVLQGAGISDFETPGGTGLKTIGVGNGCPTQGGNCISTNTGCIAFANVPAPGTYTIAMSQGPPGNKTNPGGYAACTGGSGCRSEIANVTVAADGSIQATTTNVYPNNSSITWPAPDPNTGQMFYAGTQADPILYHSFGLGNFSISCDGDSDFDDNLTGTPGGKCTYTPESSEASATLCPSYPWQCTLVPAPTPTPTSTATATPTPTSTPTPAPTPTPTPTPDPTPTPTPTGTTNTYNDTVGAGLAVSHFVATAATGDLQCSVSWNPAIGPVQLIVYDASLSVLGQTSGSSGSLTLTLSSLPVGSYKVKVKNTSAARLPSGTVTAASNPVPRARREARRVTRRLAGA